MRLSVVLSGAMLAASAAFAQDADPGKVVFDTRCSRCHGSDGNGAEMGPAIRGRLAARNDQQLVALIREGLPAQGMPAIQVTDAEMEPLTKFLRTLQPRGGREKPVVREKVTTADSKSLDGEVLNQGFD